jgi:hypothetical protein
MNPSKEMQMIKKQTKISFVEKHRFKMIDMITRLEELA